jgi:hypothetical protein
MTKTLDCGLPTKAKSLWQKLAKGHPSVAYFLFTIFSLLFAADN